MSFLVIALDDGDDTTTEEIITQIDNSLFITGEGDPTDVQAAHRVGVRYFDTANELVYICSETDQTAEGTVWQQLITGGTTASTGNLGIIQLATPEERDVTSSWNAAKAMTPLLCSVFARKGINADISSLTKLTSHILFDNDGVGDVGAASNNRPRNGFFKGFLNALKGFKWNTSTVQTGNFNAAFGALHEIDLTSADSIATLPNPSGNAGLSISFVIVGAGGGHQLTFGGGYSIAGDVGVLYGDTVGTSFHFVALASGGYGRL